MRNEKSKSLLFILILIVLSITVNAVTKNPIIERRDAFRKDMYSQLCQENPFSRYCLATYTGAIIDTSFFYDSYLIEDDFTIPSPALTKSPSVCNPIVGSRFICEDDRWLYTNSDLNIVGAGDIQLLNNDVILKGSGDLTYKVNLKNKDIQLKVRFDAGFGQANPQVSKSFAITLGGVTMFSDTTSSQSFTKNYLIGMIKDVSDKNRFAVLIDGEFNKEVIIQGETALLHINVGGSDYYDTSSNNQRTQLTIDYIKSQPYFSCQTDNNEVWISDNFGEGSTFDIHSLTYESTKFCPQDYPAVVRDYRERGVKADYLGTITEKLTRGISFTVPTYQSYEIRYATTYKEGMGTRCGLDEVLYIDKPKGINKCVKKIYEQDYIIKDCNTNPEICPSPNVCKDINNAYVCMGSQTIFRDCNTNPEVCPSPNTCQLRSGVYTCVTTINTIKDCVTNPEICPSPNVCQNINNVNICTSSTTTIVEKNCVTNPEICDKTYGEYCDTSRLGYPVCVRPYKVVEVIRDREIITVGKNQKYFTNNLKIGDKAISSVNPVFTCNPQGENWNFPQPSEDCWKTEVNALGGSYTMKNNEEVSLNDYINLKLYISGKYDKDKGFVDSYANSFVLTLKNFDFIQTETIKGDKLDYYVIKDSSKEMCFKITNNLGINFDSSQAGYSLKKTTDLVTIQTTTNEQKALTTGTTQFCIPIDSARYGELFYQVNPYFKLGDEIFFDNEQITYNYKIVDAIPTNETIVYKTNQSVITQTITETITEPFSFSDIPPVIWIGLITLFAVLIIYLSTRK